MSHQDNTSNSHLLTPEERAARVARLEELKKMQREQQLQQQAPSSLPAPKLSYGYAPDDAGEHGLQNELEPYAADEEAFLREVEAEISRAAAGGAHNQRQTLFYNPPSSWVDEVENNAAPSEAEVIKKRDVVGDFELLRLAKMGDTKSFQQFALDNELNPRGFSDNEGRNALHYAADSGDIILLKALVEAGVPFVASEKGVTPLDIALLNRHHAAVVDLLRTVQAQSATTDGASRTTAEDVVRAFAPEPPKFVLSKPVPAAPAAPSARLFWAEHPVATAASDVAVSRLTESDADPASFVKGLECLGGSEESNGFLRPLEPQVVASCWRNMSVFGALHNTSEPVGLVALLELGGQLKGSGSTLKHLTASHVAVAGCLAVKADYRGQGIAAALIRAAADALRAKQDGGGVDAVIFVSPQQLPSPPAKVCAVKWFRRALAAERASRRPYADSLFPDFFTYDETLRADSVRKGAVLPELRAKYADELAKWAAVDPSDAAQEERVCRLLQDKAASAAGVELAYVPASPEDLTTSLLAGGLRAFARVEHEAVTDFIIFRLREPLVEEGTATPIAQVVYALFTTVKLTEKADLVLLLVQAHLSADVVLVPAMFGFSESDLVKGNFDELPAWRQFLYVVSPSKPTKSLVAAVPPTKVALPVFLL